MKLLILLIFAIDIIFAYNTYKDPRYIDDRRVIVHLFEWKWNDIANECEQFLGPKGYAAVQVSPPNENIIASNRPWWERYQPMSYKLVTRSGNENEFRDMVSRCYKAGIRIYVDVVINHMTGGVGNLGTAGTVSQTGKREYQGVPYGPEDFHKPCTIMNYSDPIQVRNCELSGLHDLNQTSEHVRERIVEYLNRLVSYGVAGFRIDAAKHMWPEDLKIIYDRIDNLNVSFKNSKTQRPFIYQEVIDLGNEAVSKHDYTPLAAVTEFKFGAELGKVFRGKKSLSELKNWGPEWGLAQSGDAMTFVDNHDNQRGHGGGGADILTYKLPKQYMEATAFALAHPYGISRIMSSYEFTNTDAGPPQDADGNIISPIIDENGLCTNGWVCEHRWPQMYRMAMFRLFVKREGVTHWWDNGKDQIAFGRGDRGFIVFNREDRDLHQTFQTGLPAGDYCDIVSGERTKDGCTGKMIKVDSDGKVTIEIKSSDAYTHLAIHIGIQSLTIGKTDK